MYGDPPPSVPADDTSSGCTCFFLALNTRRDWFTAHASVSWDMSTTAATLRCQRAGASEQKGCSLDVRT